MRREPMRQIGYEVRAVSGFTVFRLATAARACGVPRFPVRPPLPAFRVGARTGWIGSGPARGPERRGLDYGRFLSVPPGTASHPSASRTSTTMNPKAAW